MSSKDKFAGYEAPTGEIAKAVGLEKTKDGWRAVYFKIQGRTVLSRSNQCEGSSKAEALEYLKIAVMRKIAPSDS